MIRRGDVVIVQFPFVGGGRGKTRPAIVIQCDRLNQQLQNTIVAMVTGNIRLIGREPTQFLVDPNTPDGKGSGLALPSAVKCENLLTIAQSDIISNIGSLSAPLIQQLNQCLLEALELP